MRDMALLDTEIQTLGRLLPGLADALDAVPFMEMESPGNPAIEIFRQHGGGALLVPEEYGGLGASPLAALRAQRAIAARSPSVAVAFNMHHLTMASLIEIDADTPGAEREFLEQVAAEKLIVASGFAEGRPGGSIQTSALRVTPCKDGVRVDGSKRPCSLARSMDLLSISLPPPPGMEAGLAATIIPADTPGIAWRPFWNSPILAGAESEEIVLSDVFIPTEAIFPLGGSGRSHAVQDRGFLWFELLISGVYLGIATRLALIAIRHARVRASDRVEIATELEGAMAALEGIAMGMEKGARHNHDLARMLLVRYAVQGAIERATNLAIEALGGLAFLGSAEPAYLLAASRGLGLHPPARGAAAERLAAHLAGDEFVVD
jgi:alkylation response protein AidB-like acyl-CoA dehydrogenase